jgi:hypothetical protein
MLSVLFLTFSLAIANASNQARPDLTQKNETGVILPIKNREGMLTNNAALKGLRKLYDTNTKIIFLMKIFPKRNKC